jgi:hypothetical protein
MIGLLLVVQVPDPSDTGGMAVALGPIDCFPLRFEGGENVIGMVFNDIVVDVRSLRAPFRPRLNVNGGHVPPPLCASLARPIRATLLLALQMSRTQSLNQNPDGQSELPQ